MAAHKGQSESVITVAQKQQQLVDYQMIMIQQIQDKNASPTTEAKATKVVVYFIAVTGEEEEEIADMFATNDKIVATVTATIEEKEDFDMVTEAKVVSTHVLFEIAAGRNLPPAVIHYKTKVMVIAAVAASVVAVVEVGVNAVTRTTAATATVLGVLG